MKAKTSFFPFFVLLFTVFIFNTASAQNIEYLTANGNNTGDSTNYFFYTTGPKFIHFAKTGDVEQGIVPKPGTSNAKLLEQSKHGGTETKKCLANNMVQSNNITGWFGAPSITISQFDAALTAFEATLYPALVNFKGHSVSEMQLTHDTVTGVWGNMYSSAGKHKSVGILPCMISRQTDKNGKVYNFIVADARCGQPFAAKTTMMMLETGEAEIVQTGNNGPSNPGNNQQAGNNGNVGGGTAGNGSLTFDQLLQLATALKATNVINAGNNNGNNNGGQGGSVTGSGNSGTPTGATATAGTTGAAATGFNFGIIPGSGNAQAGTGYSTTNIPPNNTGAGASSSANVNTGGGVIDYTKQFNGMSRGLQATGAGSVMSGIADGSREVRGWLAAFGIIGGGVGGGGTLPGSGGGLMRNPG